MGTHRIVALVIAVTAGAGCKSKGGSESDVASIYETTLAKNQQEIGNAYMRAAELALRGAHLDPVAYGVTPANFAAGLIQANTYARKSLSAAFDSTAKSLFIGGIFTPLALEFPRDAHDAAAYYWHDAQGRQNGIAVSFEYQPTMPSLVFRLVAAWIDVDHAYSTITYNGISPPGQTWRVDGSGSLLLSYVAPTLDGSYYDVAGPLATPLR